MAPPFARTSDEAHLYMRLHPCPCGEDDFTAASSVRQEDGGWVCRYTGACPGCGRERVFEFGQPDEIRVPTGGGWADDDRPSELLDAGEWLWVADTYGAADPASAEPEQVVTDLLAAAGALDEVLKFLPAGADTVADPAFWTYRGRALRQVEPGRFHRTRLEAARDTYRRLALEADHDDLG